MKKIILSLLLLAIASCGWSQVEFEPNNTIIQNTANNTFTAPVTVSANITTSSPDDRDFFKIVLPHCGTWAFNIVNPNGSPCVLKMYIYNAQNTNNWIINSGGATFDFNNGLPEPVRVNCGQVMYVQIDQTSGTNLGAYSLTVTEELYPGYTCTENPLIAPLVPLDTSFVDRLWGYDCDGNPHKSYFKVSPTNCGVLRLNLTNVPNTQNMVARIYDSSNNLVSQGYASGFGTNLELATLLSAGDYYIQLSEYDGGCCAQGWGNYTLSASTYTVTLAFDDTDPCECNNTFATACLLPVDTSIDIKIWGWNYLISNNSSHDQDEDQDFFKIQPSQCGVYNLSITGVNSNQSIWVEIFDDQYNRINTSPNTALGANMTFSTQLGAGTHYVRITEFKGSCCAQGWNEYVMADDPFTVTTNYDVSDFAECNNTFVTAYPVPVDTSFDIKLWGVNSSLAANTAFPISEDQDFFLIEPQRDGVLNMHVTGVNLNQQIYVQVYDSIQRLVNEGLAPFISSDLHFSTLLPTGKYYLRIVEYRGSCCGAGWNEYILADDPFHVILDFDTTDVGECNNSFASAKPLPLNWVSDLKIWGDNYLISDSNVIDMDEDQDYYLLDVPSCGNLTLEMSSISLNQRMQVQFYDTLHNLLQTAIAYMNGSNLNDTVPLATGTYYMRISEWTGPCCWGGWDQYVQSDDPFHFEMHFIPDALIAVGSDTICQGGSASFTSAGIGATSWLWDFGPGATPSTSTLANPFGVTFNTPGSQMVTLSVNGCAADTMFLTVLPQATTPVVTVQGPLLTSSTATTYQWFLNGSPVPGATNQTYTATQNGSYLVCISDPSTCDTACSSPTNVVVVGMDGKPANSSPQAYPNPTSGKFRISVPAGVHEILAYRSTGQFLRRIPVNGESSVEEEFPNAGVYFLQVNAADSSWTLRVVVVPR